MPGSQDIHTFAEEAQLVFLRLAERARSAGLEGTANLLQEKAGWLAAARDRGGSPRELAADVFEVEAASAVREVLLDLREAMQAALEEWPPESPEQLIEAMDHVHLASTRLHRLHYIEEQSGRLAGRRKERWGTEPPAAEEPPPFRPGQKRRP